MKVTNTKAKNGYDIRMRKFTSINEMIDYAKKPMSQESIERLGRGVEASACEEFNGATYEDGMRNAQLGWSEGWEIAKNLSNSFRIDLGETSINKKTRNDYHGQSVAMGRYLMGDPRCMKNSVRKKLKKKGKIIKLFIHTGMIARVKHKQIINRGSTILALANSLEATGYRVEIEGGFLAEGEGRTYSDYRFKIKEAEQPIDQDRMGFILVSPSMHRVLGFRVRDQEDVEWIETYGNQGGTKDYTRIKGTKEIDSDVYVGVNDNHWEQFNTQRSSKQWLKEQFEEYGIKTEEK